MGLKDYTDTKNGPQLAVLKHAVIGDRIGEVKIEKGFLKFKGTMTDKHTKEVHHCTMAGCDCEDYKKNKLPCVHMYKLALEYGMYKDIQKRGFAGKLAGLSDEAFAYFESAMYGGYYDKERDIEDGSWEKITQKIKSELSREGLLEFHRGYFVFTNHVQNEIIGYILATFSDPRSIERRKISKNNHGNIKLEILLGKFRKRKKNIENSSRLLEIHIRNPRAGFYCVCRTDYKYQT